MCLFKVVFIASFPQGMRMYSRWPFLSLFRVLSIIELHFSSWALPEKPSVRAIVPSIVLSSVEVIFNEVTLEHRRRLGNALLELFDLAFLPLVMLFALCSSCLGVKVTFPIKPLNWRKESNFQYSLSECLKHNKVGIWMKCIWDEDVKREISGVRQHQH